MGDYDATNFAITVNGKQLSEAHSATLTEENRDSTGNDGPGGRRFGTNDRANGNAATLSFQVRDTSEDFGFLTDLDKSPVTVDVELVSGGANYTGKALIGFGTPRGKMNMAESQRGADESSDIEVSVICTGFYKKYADGTRKEYL